MQNREEKKLARRREAMQLLLNELDTNHGLLGIEDAAKALNLNADEIKNLIAQGELIHLVAEEKTVLPAFQISDGKMLPHKDHALQILRNKGASNEAIITFYLNAFNGSGVTVRDALLGNPSEELLLEISREAHAFLGQDELLSKTIASA